MVGSRKIAEPLEAAVELTAWREVMNPDFWTPVLVAIVCGGMIGLERQFRGKPIGIRTSILICLGTQVFVRLGASLTSPVADPARVLGQVVTGVGFLGAGVIMARGQVLTGVTSAAVVWVLAAIGSAIGVNRPAEALALSVVTVSILIGVRMLEAAFKQLRGSAYESDEEGDDEAA
jgi:putative Mg2+ transporter-C (MgtC) family protein